MIHELISGGRKPIHIEMDHRYKDKSKKKLQSDVKHKLMILSDYCKF